MNLMLCVDQDSFLDEFTAVMDNRPYDSWEDIGFREGMIATLRLLRKHIGEPVREE